MTDQQILEGILQGGRRESESIVYLYETNARKIRSFLLSKASTATSKEPDDIIWEGLEALVLNVKMRKFEIRESSSLAAYYTEICKRLWYKHLDSEKARVLRQSIYMENEVMQIPDVSVLISQKETWDSYLVLFDKLGKNCKRIIQMTFILGYKVGDLAKKLIQEGLYENEQVVRNAKNKCLKKAMEIMNARDGK